MTESGTLGLETARVTDAQMAALDKHEVTRNVQEEPLSIKAFAVAELCAEVERLKSEV